MADLKLTIASKTLLADGIVQLDLASSGVELPTWDAGAHIDLQCGSFVRSYSLCGDPADRTLYRIAVLREMEGRGGSAFVHDKLEVGDVVGVSLPRNHFELAEADRYLFVAGGIGITPIVPMIAAAEDRSIPWALHYGGRSRSSMAFVDDLQRYAESVSVYPEDELGRLPLAEILGDASAAAKILCCGPPALLDAVAAASAHWPAESLHVERFVPKDVCNVSNRSFDVHLALRGTSHHVPTGSSILEVLDDAGIPVAASCRVGTCGTCEATVVDGIPDHRDSVLTAEDQAEGRYMMLCVSRALTADITLDL
ncbi:PDR/VanB family oxidoreductase [Rhodococcoides kyotonense]|uniref:PDR/VanB family oxidoreductase n=1 Tax=Rhodococcoides kyotonense TaxID=398843 RepID=UPI000B789A8E|nr:PDR/VanB family oxidoreductase [Rhodococcus kyotonensis]